MKRYPACILGTCCVPWDEHFQFAEEIFRRGVRLALQGTRHLYVFGTAGEGYAVTERQFDQVVTAFVDEMRQAGGEPMVGSIHLSMATTIERIQRCREQGVRQFQISLPSWGELSDVELFDFFEGVCGRFPDCQFLHYNLPRARRLVSGQQYGQLAEQHPNLVATKNTGDGMTMIRGLLEEAPQLQHFLSESGYVYGSLLSECGLLASLVTGWPRLRDLFQAGRRGDVATLVAIQREVSLVLRTLRETTTAGRIDGAYDKLFARTHDAEFPLRMQPPYSGASQQEYAAFTQLLARRLPRWLPHA